MGDVDVNEPQRTCGKRTNYRSLQDPFSDEEEDNKTFLTIEEVYTIITGDELTTVNSLITHTHQQCDASVTPDASHFGPTGNKRRILSLYL